MSDLLDRFAVTLRRRGRAALDSVVLRGAPERTHEVEVRRDVEVPMSDGVVLLGDLHLPVDGDPNASTVLIRGPYGRRGPMGAMGAGAMAARGFPAFMQSCRGTSGSGGVFTPQVDEQSDGVDTIRWIRQQDWFTGTLATFGMSYLGYTQWAVAGHLAGTEPELAPERMCLFVTMPDFGAITWDHGAFSLRNALGWSAMMAHVGGRMGLLRGGLPNPRLRKAFDVLPLSAGDTAAVKREIGWYQDWVRHESLADEYWATQSHTDSVADVKSPVVMVTGWYDIFLPWQIDTYARLVDAGNPPRLTIGPWGHADRELGATTVAETVDFLGELDLGRPSDRTAPVRLFVTGADEWRELPAWPPPGEATDLFLQAAGGLESEPGDREPSTFTYDPDDPTPTVGGPVVRGKSGPTDNQEHEARPDVLVFTGDVLTEPVEVIGEPVATIHLRSDRPSTDVFVRICDVHPDGRSMTVSDGIRRVGSVGTAATDPVPDGSGVRAIDVSLWPVAHRFAAGHRIRVQVSSGAHPRYARNPGSDEPAATAATSFVAHQEVFHDPQHPSAIRLPVVHGGGTPG